MQPTSQDLANMLPGPRFQAEQGPAQPRARMPSFAPSAVSPPTTVPLDDDIVAQQRESRRERRRLKQASPGEGRNARQSGAGESDGGIVSPTRPPPLGPPQGSFPRQDSENDMTRYGLVAEPSDAPSLSPSTRPQRRRMSSADRQSPEPPTPSEYGSDMGSPSRRVSRADMLSSRDSLESLAAGGARSGRKGSGFKKTPKAAKQAAAAAVKTSVADLHIVGEIMGASGFNESMLFCRWQLLYEPSKSWKVVRGLQQGATHACCSAVEEEDMVVWEHPLDLHMQTQSLQGWPALLLQVYARDETNRRNTFVSYGLVNLPTSPGLHHVSCQTWFAVESNRALGRTFFGWYTGLTPRLEDESFITDLDKRQDAGPFICTVGAGEVHLRLNILTRNLHQVTHHGGESLAAALERLNTNIRRSAAMEERRRSQDLTTLTEGQKQIRGAREDRFTAARSTLDARRRGDAASPAPSDSSRNPSFLDRQDRSSFRGFAGVRGSASTRLVSETGGGMDDSRSENSYTGYPKSQRDRMEALRQREAARKAAEDAKAAAAAQEGGSGEPSTSGPDAGAAAGGTAPPSRATSVSGAAGAAAGPGGTSGDVGPGRAASTTRGRAAAAAGAGFRPQAADDDGLETIDAGEAPGPASQGPTAVAEGTNATAARAAARLARRAQQRLAF